MRSSITGIVVPCSPKNCRRMSLSTPITCHPSRHSKRAHSDPIKPPEPVTSAFIKYYRVPSTSFETNSCAQPTDLDSPVYVERLLDRLLAQDHGVINRLAFSEPFHRFSRNKMKSIALWQPHLKIQRANIVVYKGRGTTTLFKAVGPELTKNHYGRVGQNGPLHSAKCMMLIALNIHLDKIYLESSSDIVVNAHAIDSKRFLVILYSVSPVFDVHGRRCIDQEFS